MRTPPFLPFRSGPPVFAPKLAPISVDAWLRPDTEASWLEAKGALMRSQAEEVSVGLGQNLEAADEAGALVCAAIGGGEDGWASALERAAAAVSDDLCVLIRDGEAWRLGPAVVCAPTFWRLRDMVGRTLGGLHDAVPGGDPELAGRIARVFDGLRPELVLERFNWTVQVGADRFTPSSAPLKARAAEADLSQAGALLHLRVERQTLRKLPMSGAVLFTIRIVIDPLRAAIADPDDQRRFAAAWRGASPEVRRYKGWPAYDRLVGALVPEALDETA